MPSSLLLLILFLLFSIWWCPLNASLKEIKGNRCELKLVADYEFFRVIGNGNYANAARYLINMIERVNGIFGSVDWGLDITGHRLVNIGFTIKEIKILVRPNYDSPFHFNAGRTPPDGADPMQMLSSFSLEEGTNGTCLCLLITAKALSSGVLGLANVRRINPQIGDQTGATGGVGDGTFIERGICARLSENDTVHRNTALISVRRRKELMITRVVDLVAAHELGHAFGSSHDDLHDEECVPQRSRDGRYVMWESANTGYERNHYLFSPCSVRAIHRVLYGLAHRCLVEERRSLCGNGILEEGEQCDGGAQIGGGMSAPETGGDDNNADGTGTDRCCTADCRLKPNAFCSPRHSECCTGQCTFMAKGHQCQAQNKEMCKDESRCSGLSDKCPQPKALPDGTACPDEGKCRAGECVSFCAMLSADLLPCLCEDEANVCRRCCRVRGGHCAPVRPPRWLPEGSMCVHGQCHRGDVAQGGGGTATALVCEKKETDSASFFHQLFYSVDGEAPRKFFADYLVFIVVILTLLVWCPCSAFIIQLDRQKHKQLEAKKAVVENNVQVVRSRKRVTPQQSRVGPMTGGSAGNNGTVMNSNSTNNNSDNFWCSGEPSTSGAGGGNVGTTKTGKNGSVAGNGTAASLTTKRTTTTTAVKTL